MNAYLNHSVFYTKTFMRSQKCNTYYETPCIFLFLHTQNQGITGREEIRYI